MTSFLAPLLCFSLIILTTHVILGSSNRNPLSVQNMVDLYDSQAKNLDIFANQQTPEPHLQILFLRNTTNVQSTQPPTIELDTVNVRYLKNHKVNIPTLPEHVEARKNVV